MTISQELHAFILRLHQQEKWKVHAIAKHVRLHHSTVRNALGILSPESSAGPRHTLADPFLPFIQESLKRYPDLTAARLFRMGAALFRRLRISDGGYSGDQV